MTHAAALGPLSTCLTPPPHPPTPRGSPPSSLSLRSIRPFQCTQHVASPRCPECPVTSLSSPHNSTFPSDIQGNGGRIMASKRVGRRRGGRRKPARGGRASSLLLANLDAQRPARVQGERSPPSPPQGVVLGTSRTGGSKTTPPGGQDVPLVMAPT